MDQVALFVFTVRSSTDFVLNALPIEVAGFDLTAGAVLNLILIALTLAMLVTRGGQVQVFTTWLPFLGVAGLSIAWAPDKGEALRSFMVLVTYACLYAMPFFLGRDARAKATLLKAMVYSSLIPCAVGLLEYAFFLDETGRVKSTFLHPNVFAFYLTVIAGAICFLLESDTVQFTRTARKFIVPYLGVVGGLIILTQTRSAWVGIVFILSVYAFLVNRRLLLVYLLAPLLLFVPVVQDRLSDLGRGTEYRGEFRSEADALNSWAWRKLMWQSAIEDASDSIVFGKGLASCGPNSLLFFPVVDPTHQYGKKGVGAHNAFVEIFYDTGLVGLLCYLGIFINLLIRARQVRALDPRGAVVIMSTVVAFVLESASDNMFDYGVPNMYFWGFVGFVMSDWKLLSGYDYQLFGQTAPSTRSWTREPRPPAAASRIE